MNYMVVIKIEIIKLIIVLLFNYFNNIKVNLILLLIKIK